MWPSQWLLGGDAVYISIEQERCIDNRRVPLPPTLLDAILCLCLLELCNDTRAPINYSAEDVKDEGFDGRFLISHCRNGWKGNKVGVNVLEDKVTAEKGLKAFKLRFKSRFLVHRKSSDSWNHTVT